MDKKIKYLIIPIIIALIIEIFICNINYFTVLLDNNIQKNLVIDDCTYIDNDIAPYIKMPNLNQKVYNIKIDLNEEYKEVYNFTVKTYCADSPNQNIVTEVEKSFNNLGSNRENIIKINNPYKAPEAK